MIDKFFIYIIVKKHVNICRSFSIFLSFSMLHPNESDRNIKTLLEIIISGY